MPNVFQVVDWITMESLRSLINRLAIAEIFNTDYNKEYQREFAVGETVRVKLPQRFTVRDGLTYNPQSIDRRETTVTVDQVFGVDFEWNSVEKALHAERSMEQIKAEYIDKAMEAVAQEIESRAALFAYQNTNNIVGVLKTNPTALSTYNAARVRMVENACPPGRKIVVVSPGMQASITNAVASVFNPVSEISKAWRQGIIGQGVGFDWIESMSLYSHTAGTWAGAVTVNGASQSGSSLTVTAGAGDTFFVGDVFNIAAVNNVNPATRRSTGVLKQFVVTEVLTAAGGGVDIVKFYPGIEGPGSAYQNVDALPGNGAALTLFPGTTTPSGYSGINGLALHRDAFALVGVKLESPTKAEIATQTRDPQTGISVRFIRMFDPNTSKMINRFDVLLGFGRLYADQCAVRVLSQT